jgi:hypothetical protein
MEATARLIVVSAARMTDDNFKKHFENRHADSMGGLTHFAPYVTPAIIRLYRSFHERLHALRPFDFDHEHER